MVDKCFSSSHGFTKFIPPSGIIEMVLQVIFFREVQVSEHESNPISGNKHKIIGWLLFRHCEFSMSSNVVFKGVESNK